MRLKFPTVTLWIASIVSIILAFKTSSEPILSIFSETWIDSFFEQFSTGNSIVFDLSIGFIVSVFFYLIIAWYPNRQRKRLIKRNFKEQYHSFKQDTILILLSACHETIDNKLSLKLTEQSEFKKFFTKPNKDEPRNIKWYDVLNGLKEYHLKELLVELEIFRNEVAYVLDNVEINDPDVFSFFKRLSQTVYKLKNSTLDSDDFKPIEHFFWQVFAGWNIIDGYTDIDIVKVMISKI
jgi:hypothetical protein